MATEAPVTIPLTRYQAGDGSAMLARLNAALAERLREEGYDPTDADLVNGAGSGDGMLWGFPVVIREDVPAGTAGLVAQVDGKPQGVVITGIAET